MHIQLKDGKQKEFVQLFESQILPALRQQKGFQDELTLVHNDRVVAISFWDDRKNAEMYHDTAFPKLVEKLNSVIQGAPRVETYDVATSTLAVAA